MKILLLHNYYQQRGGEDFYVDSLVNLLKNNGEEVAIFAENNRGKTQISIFSSLIESFLHKNLEQTIDKFKPDVIHINNIYPFITPSVYWLLKKKKIPIVQTIHTYRFLCANGIFFRNNRSCTDCLAAKSFLPALLHGCYHRSKTATAYFMLKNSFKFKPANQVKLVNMFVFPSQITQEYHRKYLGIPASKSRVVPHFYSYKVSNRPKKKKKYFVYLGRVAEEKGIADLVCLFRTLPQLKLIVIGNGPLLANLKAKASSNVVFTGYVSEKHKMSYLRSALFTIIPTKIIEQGPLVLMESFACGTAVIVPKHGSFIQKVKNHHNGLFYTFGDYKNLKKVIVEAATNSNRAIEMGLNARQSYKDKYSSDAYYSSLKNIYSDLIGNFKTTR